MLGAKPIVGRGFLPDEDATPGAKLVCVLGYGEWQQRFGGDRSIVGRSITLNGQGFTVVGVMPKGFKGTNAIGAPALWFIVVPVLLGTAAMAATYLPARRATRIDPMVALRYE